MRVSMMQRTWHLFRPRLKNDYGWCDPPWVKNKQIAVSSTVKAEKELDTIIHECTHAAFFSLSEDIVNEISSQIANVLWRLNFRKRHRNRPAPKNKQRLISTIQIHARLHLPFFKEGEVLRYAEDIGVVLYRLGYRQVGEYE